jgi:HEAT repeat protein
MRIWSRKGEFDTKPEERMVSMGLFGKPNIEKMSKEDDINGLANALKYRDPQVRLAAAEVLSTKAKVLSDFIINHALEGESDAARGYFAGLIAAHEDRYYSIGELPSNLIKRMRTIIDDPRFCADLEARLKKIQTYALAPLTSMLQDPNDEVRRSAANALAILKSNQ